MTVLIAGCGYVGTALGESLVRDGVEVVGLRRTDAGLGEIAQKGIVALKADLLDPASLKNLPHTDTVVLCQAISRDTDSYKATYLQGTNNLLDALGAEKPKIIFISSTSVYGTHDGSWVDELTDPRSHGYSNATMASNAECLLSAEKAVLERGGVAFRLAGIYGPSRHRIAALKSGKMKPSLSETFTNRIHRDDIVAGLRLLMDRGQSGEIYIGADDYPSTQKEFYAWLYEKLRIQIPSDANTEAPTNDTHLSNKRCSNAKIKALGLWLKYPSFREGYSEIIGEP